ncbi:hypothetical protein QVD17_03246 [Tagetes erecta]|uniref:Uncharacterized protein n=1 Tax=Tagetes erecta TaxID=13708 RepID=A0AAD8LH63_TARER|nr:hypothetical protein QVD17_03246 [Tagetes erecta]
MKDTPFVLNISGRGFANPDENSSMSFGLRSSASICPFAVAFVSAGMFLCQLFQHAALVFYLIIAVRSCGGLVGVWDSVVVSVVFVISPIAFCLT